MYEPKYMFVVSDLMVAVMDMAFSFVPLVGIVILTGTKITWLWLLIPLPLILTFFFTLGLCLIMSTYGVFFRDLQHLYGVITRAWFFFTPLVYDVSARMGDNSKWLFLWDLNPLVSYINIFRSLVYNVTLPSPKDILIAFIYSVLTFALGCVIFNENQNKFFLYM